MSRKHIHEVVRRLAVESIDFFAGFIKFARRNDADWIDEDVKGTIKHSAILIRPISLIFSKLNKPVTLMGMIKRHDNPFAHENAALLLLSEVMNNYELSTSVDLPNSKVSCDNWVEIQGLNHTLKLDLKFHEDDALYRVPAWVQKCHKPLYRLGIFLRSCLMGSVDWTSSLNRLPLNGGYRGITTSFYKRQLSMMNTPEALSGIAAPMSSWLTSLLFHLLQWPGLDVSCEDDEFIDLTWESLKNLVNKRLDSQKSIFCRASSLPAYIERVNLDWDSNKKDLKVVMVQSLLPKKSDFVNEGFGLNSPAYRSKHRRHIAAVSELILHKVFSHNSIDDVVCKEQLKVDLIVWPELSVNFNDIDILKKIADKTGAMIFAGLTPIEQPDVAGLNNVGVWIIPKKTSSGRQYIIRFQGKNHMTQGEKGKIQPWRPYQLLVELMHPISPRKDGFILTASICYDATDIKLTADLKGKSHGYVVAALNQDVATFDSMVDALYYHMYQYVVLVNSGEFGGSVAKAPYKERHDKLITHVHGKEQVSISSFEMNMFDFRAGNSALKSGKKVKTKPAG